MSYFEVIDEDRDAPIYLYANRLWIDGDRVFFELAHEIEPKNEKFDKEKEKNVYSISKYELRSLHISFLNAITREYYEEESKDDIFEKVKVDLMIFDGLDKLKGVFKDDEVIINILDKVKLPFGIMYYEVHGRFKDRVLKIKEMLGNNFIVMGPIINNEIKIFLKKNNIKVISDKINFINKLKDSL